jgi:hypothetical protein
MRTFLIGLLAGLALDASGGIPIDLLPDEPRTNDPGRGIFVPDPTRGMVGTNAAPIRLGDDPAQPGLPANYQANIKVRPAPARNTDVVRMRGRGEEWLGKLSAWNGSTVVWDTPVARGPVRFQCGRIAGVSLAAPARPPVLPSRWSVRLVNGDVLTGAELTMETNTVTLALDATNSFRIPRGLVASVQQESGRPRSRFRALEAPAGWDVMSYEWPGMNQQAQPARVYRDLDLPDRVAIEFPYAVSDPTGQNTVLQISLFVTSPERMNFVPHYMISIQNYNQTTTVYCNSAGGSSWGGGANSACQLDLRPSRGRTWVELGFRVDRQAGRLVLTVDGEEKKAFEMRRLSEESGRGILIQCGRIDQRPPRRMILTPLGEEDQGFGVSKTQDTLLCANGAVMAGRMGTIGATNFVFDSSMGRMNLPLDRLTAVNLALSARRDSRPKAGDVMIALRGGGQLTGGLTALTPDGVVADVEWAGSLSLPRAAVDGVWWEPYPQGAAKTPVEQMEETFRLQATWWPGTVQLTDGQRLEGTLAGFDTNSVYLKYPAAAEVVALRREKVAWGATLVPTSGPAPAPVELGFVNGDQARGILEELNAQTIKMKFAWGDTLDVARAQVARVRFHGAADGALDTGSSANWKTTTVAVQPGMDTRITLTNGVATFPIQNYGTSLYRQGALPQRLCLQFDLIGLDVNHQLQLQAFGRSASRGNEGMCMLSLGGMHATLQTYGGNFQNNVAQSFPLGGSLGDRAGVNVIWLLDRARRAMSLVLDGKMVGTLQGRSEFPNGDGISLAGGGGGGARLQLRRIIVSEWRGSADLLGKAPADADSVWRHDLTRVSGNLVRTGEGRVYLATGTGSGTNVPLNQISWIDFRASGVKPDKIGSGSVRLYLQDGDRLLLSNVRHEMDLATGAQKIVGTSPVMGTVTVPLRSIVRADFCPRDGA